MFQLKFCPKTFETCSLLYVYVYIDVTFSNYFVLVLAIRAKYQEGTNGPGGRGEEKIITFAPYVPPHLCTCPSPVATPLVQSPGLGAKPL